MGTGCQLGDRRRASQRAESGDCHELSHVAGMANCGLVFAEYHMSETRLKKDPSLEVTKTDIKDGLATAAGIAKKMMDSPSAPELVKKAAKALGNAARTLKKRVEAGPDRISSEALPELRKKTSGVRRKADQLLKFVKEFCYTDIPTCPKKPRKRKKKG